MMHNIKLYETTANGEEKLLDACTVDASSYNVIKKIFAEHAEKAEEVLVEVVDDESDSPDGESTEE